MLSAPRRAPAGRMSKAELSDQSVLSPPYGGVRWSFNGNGQLVDSASAGWELADEIGKMRIGGDNDGTNPQLHTPPPSKGSGLAQFHEVSPMESSSETSLESGPSSTLDPTANALSHSRESSADTTASQTLRGAPMTPMKVGAVGESRNRPHSYSGGLSSTDLTRLQQAGGSPGNKESWSSSNGTPDRQQAEQPSYPSLTVHTGGARTQDLPHFSQLTSPGSRPDDLTYDYQAQQQRQFNAMHLGPPLGPGGAVPSFVHGRPNNMYRQPPRTFNPTLPPVMPSPTNFAYAAPPPPMSISNPQQQLYEMMLPTPPLDNPTMARLQQQGPFRGTHQHSTSDPVAVRDPAALALLNSNIQAFAAGQMYPPNLPPPAALSMFASQFYGNPQDVYASPDLATAQMMARLQSQYGGAYGVPLPGQNAGVANPTANGNANPQGLASVGPGGAGPSANNRKLGLYKTELCRSWEEKGTCRYGAKCQFAHGEEELRKVQRHPKYKTEICRTFWVSGSCPYGKRCCFIHTELPASGAPPGADGAPPPSNLHGRDRSGSTNSDPNEVSTSLLARISARRSQEIPVGSNGGSGSTTPPSATYSSRPRSLHVDTSILDPAAGSKQNKSAYPTFAHNGILRPAGEDVTARSPGPVTAGPDFGRHASARLDIVGSQRQMSKNAASNSNVRNSFNGGDMQLDFSTTPTATNMSTQLGSSPEAPKPSSRINGHVRSGSAGNWGSATRANHFTAYPLSSIPGGEVKTNSPWADYTAGSRLAEQNWT
ncbi:uncharacterized protein C8Q71DRAFT_97440 [Rhodofomes roseus]|uniref:C3H1-type domain-containing protein n=2 Tax=Rhodofomes roseus TaxID=34475 RepID=A0ABQ8KDW1_9APHY|nr:uncharacterized protein C8Q71DRAFT_97440 [Rhodofomes roseus]KAH9835810.1 hypothetical protein C8Q71DRAFT_97440 [Rhodofomes roseus]